MVSPAAASVGEPLTFTILVSNAGPGTATDVVLADAVPTGLTPTAVSDPACTLTGQDLSCRFATLAMGASRQVTLTVLATAAGGFTNTASVSAATPDPQPDNNVGAVGGVVTEAVPPTTQPPATAPPGSLPATGSSSPGPELQLGALLMLAGIAVVVATLRRRGRQPC